MGNYVSCALSKTTSSDSSSPSTKVILPDGEVRDINVPTKAAELMMEMPSHFLADAKSLKIGRKLISLAADDDLDVEGCHVYVAFHMTRVASAANASDMARIFMAGKKRLRSCDNRKVSPEEEEEEDVRLITGTKLNLEDIEEFSAVEFMHRISVSKSKKPELETIVEENVSL
ncbi:hypothetical protein Bca4012_086015 [Brassica carinata]|uniref:Uncharacterized protein n=1 Tax=Brassica carinata TaxID=52824 RepID=A0A8X7QP08_BRACI|nr:hypothetical protein Bca52824_067777 [Brassica carinata]KAG2273223.1 hypothetical protein Bca52824_067778 [Brassica carinata]